MFKKYFVIRKFIKELEEGIVIENINVGFAREAYLDLEKIQGKDVELLQCYENDLKEISNQEHANKEGKEAVKNLKNKIKNIEAKIEAREITLESLSKGIQERKDKVLMYQRKIEFVKKHG